MVLNESEYKHKLNTLLESRVYELLPADSTAEVDRKMQKLLSKNETALLTGLKHKLTPYHSRSPHLYALPKICNPDISLRPIVSSACFLHKILSSLA